MNEHGDLKQLEQMLERVLNAKGRIRIKTQPWWWNILTYLLGIASATVIWVWSGKADLENISRLIQSKISESETIHDNITNHVNRSVQSLSFRVNRIAAQSWTKDQMYVWGEQLRRFNTNITDVPDSDRIRQQFPMQLE